MIVLGLDWAEVHHDVALLDDQGAVLGELRVADTADGVAQIHALIRAHGGEPGTVIVGTESMHGLVPRALAAAGSALYEINPLAASRYRERHHLSGAKSDRGNARMLADVVRTDRPRHRRSVSDSALAEGIAGLARSHPRLIQERQTQVNAMRSTLRQYYPALLQAFPHFAPSSSRGSRDAMAVLERAPTPAAGRRLSAAPLQALLRRGARQRQAEPRAEQIRAALRSPQLAAPPLVTSACGTVVRATARIVGAMTVQIEALTAELARRFEEHPDAKILRRLPGLGGVLGARELGEFGDAPTRDQDARASKHYATTAPATRASGTQRRVLARRGGNRHLGDPCRMWAFNAIQASPGARRYYDTVRGRQKTTAQALRTVANRLAGILHACLAKRALSDEAVAWPTPLAVAA